MKTNIMLASIIVAVGLIPQTLLATNSVSRQQQVLDFRAENNYDAAINMQSSLVEQAEGRKSISKKALSIRYFNLGILLFEDGQYQKAIKPLERSLDITRESEGIYAESLIRVLSQLGVVLLKLNYVGEALDRFHEAQHIVHRLDGVKSIKQSELLSWMTIAEMKKSKIQAADTLQRFRYDIFKSTYGEFAPETVPALLSLGKWLQSSAQYSDAVTTYEQAVEISEDNNLEAQVLHSALAGLAHTYYLKGKCCADEFMTRAAEVVSNDAAFDNFEKSQAYIKAADMSLVLKGFDKSQALYQEAFHYGGTFNNAEYEKPAVLGISRIDRMVRAYRPENVIRIAQSSTMSFGGSKPAPVKIVGAPLPFCANEIKDLAQNRDFSNYVVNLNFSVSPEGRASNIRVIDTNAPTAIIQLVRRIVRLYRYRPKLTDGKPVREEMQMRQTFGAPGTESQNQFAVGQLAALHGCHLLALN